MVIGPATARTIGSVGSRARPQVFRNRWVIEKESFFEARTATAQIVRDETIGPQEAVRQHPELAGTYLNLRAAEFASRALRDPEDQRRFVAPFAAQSRMA